MTQSEQDELVRLWRDEVSAKRIAERIGYSVATVVAYAMMHRDLCPYRNKRTGADVRKRWVARIRQGTSTVRDAAKALGVHPETVRRWLRCSS